MMMIIILVIVILIFTLVLVWVYPNWYSNVSGLLLAFLFYLLLGAVVISVLWWVISLGVNLTLVLSVLLLSVGAVWLCSLSPILDMLVHCITMWMVYGVLTCIVSTLLGTPVDMSTLGSSLFYLLALFVVVMHDTIKVSAIPLVLCIHYVLSVFLVVALVSLIVHSGVFAPIVFTVF